MPATRFDPARFNYLQYRRQARALGRALRRAAPNDLPGQVRLLIEQQRAAGFIEDDLRAATSWHVPSAARNGAGFFVQHNPSRARRFVGAGRRQPPRGVAAVNAGCFICPFNVAWAQRGVEMGLDVRLGGRAFVVYPNAFPLKPCHVVCATAEHVGQQWAVPGGGGLALAELVDHTLELAARLPGFVVFFNGAGAGASIPSHLHLQAFARAESETFPLEFAARARKTDSPLVPDYPLTALHLRTAADDRGGAASTLCGWITTWEASCGRDHATANIIATADREGRLDVYFIPRHRRFQHGIGMAGVVAALESLGELVLSNDDEKRRLEAAQIDGAFVERLLAAINPPGADAFVAKVAA